MKVRNYSIDFLKLLFTTVIVLHHSELLSGVLKRGYVTVEFFFFLSGYYLCPSLEKGVPIIQFVKRRAQKLFPGYLSAFLAISAAFLVMGQYSYKAWYGPFLEVLLLQNVGIPNSGGINYPLWYLSVLFFGGTLVYAMKRTMKLRWFIIFSGLIVVLTYGFLIFNSQNVECWETVWGVLYIPFWRGVADMIIGVWLYYLPKPSVSVRKILQSVGLTVSMALLFLPGKLDFFAIVCLGLTAYSSTGQDTVFTSICRKPIFLKCYPFQYFVYLNHALAIYICFFIFERVYLPLAFKLLLTIFTTALLSFVMKVLTDFSSSLLTTVSLRTGRHPPL